MAVTARIFKTTMDQSCKLSEQEPMKFTPSIKPNEILIEVEDNKRYQEIDGIGASITGSTAWVIRNLLDEPQQREYMKQLFDPEEGIGFSILRQPIGGSDQNAPDQPRSYDDNAHKPDPELTHFSIDYDIQSGIIDLIREAMALNPQLKVLGTPWSLPMWMLKGIGAAADLNPLYYSVYARYMVKFIRAYEEQGIPIWAITIQNEPVYSFANFDNNISREQQNELVKNHLGPLFRSEGIATKIIIFDHNWDYPAFPEFILGDPETNPYVAGTAWHYYGGEATAMTRVQQKFPDKGTYFTEASPPIYNTDWPKFVTDREGANVAIEIFRNWSKTYIGWTIASNTQYGPGSCTFCGAVGYVDQETRQYEFSLSYYLFGHFSKFVKPGAYRIKTTDYERYQLRSVGFQNPDGSIALVVFNDSFFDQTFTVCHQGNSLTYSLPPRALATFIWQSWEGS